MPLPKVVPTNIPTPHGNEVSDNRFTVNFGKETFDFQRR
jgi:hypothetical protein